MLRDGTGFAKIVIVCGKVDLRRGIDGLAAIIRQSYNLNPLEAGTLFLFCGNRADRIKGLLYERDGFLLLYKRLAEGFRFQWPRTPEEARNISMDEFRMLMDGYSIKSTNKQK